MTIANIFPSTLPHYFSPCHLPRCVHLFPPATFPAVCTCVGGQKKRVALAGTLLGKPDLLVLDEPTNHMDVEMIAWMENELKKNGMAVVLVTHDRCESRV